MLIILCIILIFSPSANQAWFGSTLLNKAEHQVDKIPGMNKLKTDVKHDMSSVQHIATKSFSDITHLPQNIQQAVKNIPQDINHLPQNLEHLPLEALQLPAKFTHQCFKIIHTTTELADDIINVLDIPMELIKYYIRKKFPISKPNHAVNVQTTTDLSPEEQLFLKNREQKVSTALKAFNIDQPLRIALCCSGGGCRAMTGTLGFLQGAQESGVLDASLYIAALSGSTWLVAPWTYMYLQNKISSNQKQSFLDVQKNLETALTDPIMTLHGLGSPPPLEGDKTIFTDNLIKRFGYNQPLSIINLYGPLVGNFALKPAGPDRLNVTWSSLASKMVNADIPLPLCSSVYEKDFSNSLTVDQYQRYGWFETNPFQAGSSELGYIPTQYLGSGFQNGQLNPNQICPEYPIPFLMGVYGSAFAINMSDMYRKIIDGNAAKPSISILGHKITIPINKWIDALNTIDPGFANDKSKRIFAHFNNFSQNLPTSVLKKYPIFGMIDGGIDINFPLALLLERPQRNLDVIFIYDSAPGEAPVFHEAAKYFKAKNFNMPDVSQVTKESLQSKPMTIFNDPRESDYNPAQPTFIYFPTLHIDLSKPPYTTFNFKYSAQDIDHLVTLMKSTFLSQMPAITTVLQKVAANRYPSQPTRPQNNLKPQEINNQKAKKPY